MCSTSLKYFPNHNFSWKISIYVLIESKFLEKHLKNIFIILNLQFLLHFAQNRKLPKSGLKFQIFIYYRKHFSQFLGKKISIDNF